MAQENRDAWLKGWTRQGAIVLMGVGIHCAGCGREGGVTNVASPAEMTFPERDPDWPFPEDDCPICTHWTREGRTLTRQEIIDQLMTLRGLLQSLDRRDHV